MDFLDPKVISYLKELSRAGDLGENPLLDLWRRCNGRVPTARPTAASDYAWAVPTPDALEVIAEHAPIVEMGAGAGYWAALLRERGVQIDAWDGFTKQFEYNPKNTWTSVKVGSVEVLGRYPTSVALLLVWPPYNDPFGADCLDHFRGNKVIYVGEGAYGCTGDDRFHSILDSDWTPIDGARVGRWNGIGDRLTVYERKRGE